MSRSFPSVAVLAALALAGTVAAKDKAPDLRPYTLAVEARWGHAPGPEAFRADVERALAASAARGCVAEIAAGSDAVSGGRSDLVLIVTLDGYIEEIRFDDSLATAVTPGEPTKELRRVAVVEVDNTVLLTVRDGDREVATKSFRADVTYRPMYIGEEPQATARTRVIEEITDETRKLLCKTGGKLAARIREEAPAR